jgi:hypothetical protein
VTRELTPSQTAGPFLAIGLPWPDGPYVVPEGTPGAGANAADPVLAAIADAGPRATLNAAQSAPGEFRFDVRLQGERETVFFDV